MSSGLLGIDIGAARSLAASLSAWSTRSDDIRDSVSSAELLSDLRTGVLGIIDEIGADGSTIASAIRRAADELSLFSIDTSQFAIHAAVASIYSFRGGDNDPELDRRVRRLQGLVDASTDSDEHAARVMSALLAAGRPDGITTAMGEIERLNMAAARGEISGNDHRIDQEVGTLRAALAGHASSDEHLDVLVSGFVADNNRTPALTLLASLLTQQPVSVVRAAHANGWDYDVAAGVSLARRVDRLTSALRTAPFPERIELERERTALFTELANVTDTATLNQFAAAADHGQPALLAIEGVWRQQVEQERAKQIDLVAQTYGLDDTAAALKFDFMTHSVQEMVANGWDIDDAAAAVSEAALHGIDISNAEDIAVANHLSLESAVYRMGLGAELEMTIAEVDAFIGFYEHFDTFDAILDGERDGLVSVEDLSFIINNYDPVGSEAELAARQDAIRAAAAFRGAIGLRHRLDSAAQTGSVVSQNPYGRDREADNKYSRVDMESLIAKQQTNFALRRVVDDIDVARTSGTLGNIDDRLTEADFEMVRAHHQEYGLTESEVVAIDRVLEADWYHPTFWQDHGDSFVLGAAVVAGVLAGMATAGVASGVAGMLIASAATVTAGATTGAGLTLAENAWTGDPLTEDLAENMALGAVGGFAGGGAYAFLNQPAGGSLAVRVLGTVGPTADVVGLAAAGLFDPALAPVVDDIDLNQMRGDFQNVNYVLGATSVITGGLTRETLQETAVRGAGVGLDTVIADLDDVEGSNGAGDVLEMSEVQAHD